jgi:negative regulator of replication initiation
MVTQNDKRKVIRQKTREKFDYIGKIPKTMRFKNQKYKVNTWRDILRIIMQKIYEEKKEDFIKVMQIKGSRRTYFSKNGRKKRHGGVLIVPVEIPNTPFYFEGNINSNRVVSIIREIFEIFGYDSSDIKIECY